MTQPMTTSSGQPSVFDAYANMAAWAALATGVCTLANPVYGAALGTYFVTVILIRAAFDASGIEEAGALGKATKFVLSFLAGMGTSIGILTALEGAVSVTPRFIGGMIGLTAFQALIGLQSNRPQNASSRAAIVNS